MRVTVDDDTGSVYVECADGPMEEHNATHQFEKFGVKMYWDGHGKLLAVRFDGQGDGLTELQTVSSMSSSPATMETNLIVQLNPAVSSLH